MPRPGPASANPNRWLILAVLLVPVLVSVIDATIVNVALPTLVRDLHASASELQWVIDAYVLAFAGCMLTAASLGDRFGRKRVLEIGLTLFGASSLLAALSTTPAQLIASRAAMGVASAMVMPITLSIITHIFNDPDERARAFGILSGNTGFGLAAGPIVGGLLLNHFWWGAAFIVNVPIVALALVLAHRLVPESRDPTPRPGDPVGGLLSSAALALLLWATIEGSARGWGAPATAGTFVLAAAALVAFVAWELASDHPMLDLSLFTASPFAVAVTVFAMSNFFVAGALFLGTQYLQFVVGYDPLTTGYCLVPMAVLTVLCSLVAAPFADRWGTKRVVTAGFVVELVGLGLLARTNVASSSADLIVGLSLMGGGMGLLMGPAIESTMAAVPAGRVAVGSAVSSVMRQLGTALGVGVLGSVLASSYRSGLGTATGNMGLPSDVVDRSRLSLGSALEASTTLPATVGSELATAAKAAFSHGMVMAFAVSAGLCLVVALASFAFLPTLRPHREVEAAQAPGLALENRAGPVALAGPGAVTRICGPNSLRPGGDPFYEEAVSVNRRRSVEPGP